MASSALASSAPSWQVDIPGLSQLILNVGSHGLKQLAMAGVDIHSIGCMLMIAEFTPASQEFRKKISLAREAQRSERLWLYKVVEIGASTNFLADQLLKTRAGENVLALMAATIPVMDEEMCTTTLTAIFEGAKVSLENTPGLNQLKAIRSDLVTLSRKTGFGEKVVNYHKFLQGLSSNPASSDPYLAVPVATDIASIIRMLYKLVSNDEPYVFICWGLRGAAWISAYASDILGLKVCALRADRTSVPVTGSYNEAKVLLELDTPTKQCCLYLRKDMQEHFKLQAFDPGKRKGWSIDCTQVNFLDYRHLKVTMSESLGRISVFTALETLNRVSALASAVPEWTLNRQVLKGSNTKIGFYKFTEREDCPTYTAWGHAQDPVQYYETDHEQYDYASGSRKKRKERSRYGQYLVSGSLMDTSFETDRLRYYVIDPTALERGLELLPRDLPKGTSHSFKDKYQDWLPHLQDEMMITVEHAARFASHLAFSDWERTLRQMSVRFLRFGSAKGQEQEMGYFEAHMASSIPMCTDSSEMSTLENKLWSADWLALDLDGIVVHRNTASYHSIHDLRGKFFGFVSGRITFDGNHCSKVRADRVGISYQTYIKNVDVKTFPDHSSSQFRALNVRSLLSTVGDTLFVRLEGFLNSKLTLVGDASRVSHALPDMLVSVPCPHGYNATVLPILPSPKSFNHQNEKIEVFRGLAFHSETRTTVMSRHKRIHIYHQMVDNNPLGQWLACHWVSSNDRALTVLQRDCCYGCILDRLYEAYTVIEASGHPLPAEGMDICLIAGGVEDFGRPQQGSTATLPSRMRSDSAAKLDVPLHKSDTSRRRSADGGAASNDGLRPASHRRAVSSDGRQK